jgi:xylulokinase
MTKYLVGIDEGTTGCKTCVFDEDGNVLGSDYREYPCHYPQPGWVEQYPEEMLPALFESCRVAIERAGVAKEDIAGVALSTQAAVVTLLDDNGELIRPFIGWQDVRGAEQIAKIADRVTPSRFYAIAGERLGAIFSSSKLDWVRENEPENWKRTKTFATHQDYFLSAFGARERWTDISSASRDALFDVDAGEWSPELHDALHISIDQRPKVSSEAGMIVGHVSARVAELTGLAEGTPLCLGAHDQNCSTLGAGGVHHGTAVMVLGTFGSCYVVSDKPIRDPLETLVVKGNHGVGNWTIEGFSNTAASSFRWYRDVFADLEVAAGRALNKDPYDLITQAVHDVPPGSRGVIFLPYLQGAAGAHPNPNATGTFLGMSLATTKADMARAVLEGIAFEMLEVIEAQENAGIEVDTVRLTGGAAKSPTWCQLLADVFQRPIELLQTSETGCLGAALYAGTAVGIYPDIVSAVERAVTVTARFEPDPSCAEAYRAAFDRYQRVYSSLADSVFVAAS